MFLRIPAISALLWIAGAVLANAQDVISIYTNLDPDNDCEWVSSEYDGASAVSTVDADGEMFEKDILVVSSVANPDLPIADRTSCHIAYVDPSVNTNANQLARQAAHLAARTFRCGVDIPIYIGAIGEQTLSTNHWHPINFED